MHSSPAPIFRLQGSHREIGRQLGEQASEQIKHSIEAARVFIEKAVDYLQLDWQGAQIQSRKYIPFAQERYPRYV
ncbi:MAG: hypothetical protein ACK2UW_08480, partial [Anaerolineales bacterium]